MQHTGVSRTLVPPFCLSCVTCCVASFCLQPMAESEVTIEAWYMDDSDADQRLPHRYGP